MNVLNSINLNEDNLDYNFNMIVKLWMAWSNRNTFLTIHNLIRYHGVSLLEIIPAV